MVGAGFRYISWEGWHLEYCSDFEIWCADIRGWLSMRSLAGPSPWFSAFIVYALASSSWKVHWCRKHHSLLQRRAAFKEASVPVQGWDSFGCLGSGKHSVLLTCIVSDVMWQSFCGHSEMSAKESYQRWRVCNIEWICEYLKMHSRDLCCSSFAAGDKPKIGCGPW